MTEEVKEHLQTSIFVNFHHASWYPPCTHSAVSQLYMDNVGYSFSQITPLQWINLELCLVGFPKPVPPLALCSLVLDLLGWKVRSSWWMPTHFWTLHPLPIWCSFSTPPPNTSINVKCDSFHIMLVLDIVTHCETNNHRCKERVVYILYLTFK